MDLNILLSVPKTMIIILKILRMRALYLLATILQKALGIMLQVLTIPYLQTVLAKPIPVSI